MKFFNFRGRVLRTLAWAAAAALAGSIADAAPPEKRAVMSPSAATAPRPLSPKIDAALGRLIVDQERGAPLTWALPSSEAQPLIRTELGSNGEVLAAVFVRTVDVEKTKADFAALGGYVRVEAGDILVGAVPVTSLEALAATRESVSIEASFYDTPQLDVSRAATKADLVQAGTGLSSPRTGTGVIVGVVDSGIDYTRPDFKTSSGTTRIRSIWDLGGVAAGGSARICSSSDINAGTCSEADLDGHGTHVTGIAAGAGRLQSGFVGMAPDADIISAKATRSTTASGSFANDDVVAAASYIFQQATAAGKPAVINMSLGGLFGRPLDGSTSYEQSLSNLTGPGKIIVAAAGNSGGSFNHLSYSTFGTSWTDGPETPWNTPSDKSASYVGAFYDSGSISFGIAARTDSSTNTAILSAPIAPGGWTGGTIDLIDTSTSTVLAHYYIDARTTSYSGNGSHYVEVMLQPVASRYFSIYTFGSGHFDAWPSNMTFGTRTDASTWLPGDNQMTIGSPGTAKKVIAVGAYTTKMNWVDVSGAARSFTSWCASPFTDALGKIACFSSLGPTRDGRTKPEISAPGHRIASDLSVSSLANHQTSDQLSGGKLLLESGTSQASPHIAGIVALMLQTQPSMTYDQVVQTLQNTATHDGFTGSGLNNTFGGGKVNAQAAVQSLGGGGGGGGGSANCTADANTMCLAGGRFAVQATYRDYSSNTGQGRATKLTDTSGYFYFFDATNIELVAKFVSFCSGSSGNWAIYASGLTDVEVTFKVTDTKTALHKEYTNALGHRFTTIGDGPFTCP